MVKNIQHPARKPGWEVAFAKVQGKLQSEEFAYGTADCMTLVGDVSLALTGFDPIADHRGKYGDKKTALKALEKAGFKSIKEAMSRVFLECAPAQARRGDCGIIERDGEQIAVVVLGAMVWGRSAPRGRLGGQGRFEPLEAMTLAYRVG